MVILGVVALVLQAICLLAAFKIVIRQQKELSKLYRFLGSRAFREGDDPPQEEGAPVRDLKLAPSYITVEREIELEKEIGEDGPEEEDTDVG